MSAPEKHGFYFVNRLLEYQANLLNKYKITSEVEEEHTYFICMLFLSKSFKLGRAFIVQGGNMPVLEICSEHDGKVIEAFFCMLLSGVLTMWFFFFFFFGDTVST